MNEEECNLVKMCAARTRDLIAARAQRRRARLARVRAEVMRAAAEAIEDETIEGLQGFVGICNAADKLRELAAVIDKFAFDLEMSARDKDPIPTP